LSVFSPRITDALEFAIRNRVCFVRRRQGCDINILLGIPGYEEEAINRAVDCGLTEGYVVRICSAEDLIIHKAVAGRPQDLFDIESIIMRQGDKLQVKYPRKWLKEFSHLLESKEIIERFEAPWKRVMEEG